MNAFGFFCHEKQKSKKKANSFVCFLGESKAHQSAYNFIWPLAPPASSMKLCASAILFGPPTFKSSWISKHVSRPCNSTSVFTLVHRCCVWWCHSPKDEEAAVGSSRGLKMFSYCFIMTRPPSWGHLPLSCRRWRTPPPTPLCRHRRRRAPCQRKFVNTFAVKRTRSRITSIGVSGNRGIGISKPCQYLWLRELSKITLHFLAFFDCIYVCTFYVVNYTFFWPPTLP